PLRPPAPARPPRREPAPLFPHESAKLLLRARAWPLLRVPAPTLPAHEPAPLLRRETARSCRRALVWRRPPPGPTAREGRASATHPSNAPARQPVPPPATHAAHGSDPPRAPQSAGESPHQERDTRGR